jgi:tyrosinase
LTLRGFVSEPVDNPARSGQPAFVRADLVFYGVDHSGPSFEARIYFNADKVDESTDRESGSFAGSFTVFGHGGCAGDEGHCDVPDQPRDAFDRRPPHALSPQTKTVIVTDALRRIKANELVITVVAVGPGSNAPRAVDALMFDRFSLLTYS